MKFLLLFPNWFGALIYRTIIRAMRIFPTKIFTLIIAYILVHTITMPTANASENRVALVIGNDDYQNISTLKKAVNDARAMRRKLKDLNFDVIYVENASFAQMRDAGFKFTSKLTSGDIGFVFYAGHGANMLGANLLLPVDIPSPVEVQNPKQKKSEERRLSAYGLPETFFMERAMEAGARVGIFVLDACRNNPLRLPVVDNPLRSSLSGDLVFGLEGGLRRKINPPRGLYTLYSAGFGETALDRLRNVPDNNPNSPFTRTLLDNMSLPNMDFHTVAKKTQSEVFELAKSDGHQQTPTISEQVIGDKIYLNGNNEDVILPVVVRIPDIPGGEDEIENQRTDLFGSKWFMTVYNGLDFWGRDIIPEGIAVDDIEQCASECALDTQCKHFTYNEKQNHCFIKSGFDFVVRSKDAISGFIYDENQNGDGTLVDAQFPVTYRSEPGVAFDSWIVRGEYQPNPDSEDIASCLNFCESTSYQCNYLTFNDSVLAERKCTVRNTKFSMSRDPNRRASSFVRIDEVASPDIGPIPLPIGSQLTSGLISGN